MTRRTLRNKLSLLTATAIEDLTRQTRRLWEVVPSIPTNDITNNRFTTGQGYTFDLAGNIITDAEGRSFVYDAENKQKSVTNTSGTIGTYLYDGDGKQVKKYVPASGETTIFIYDASGKMVAEYSTITPPQPQVSYLTTDHLGSPRITTMPTDK